MLLELATPSCGRPHAPHGPWARTLALPHAQSGGGARHCPVWLLVLCVITLKFLAILSFNVCFVSEVPRDRAEAWSPGSSLVLLFLPPASAGRVSSCLPLPAGDTATLCTVFSQEGPGQRGKKGSGMHTCLDKPGAGPQVSVFLEECDIKQQKQKCATKTDQEGTHTRKENLLSCYLDKGPLTLRSWPYRTNIHSQIICKSKRLKMGA